MELIVISNPVAVADESIIINSLFQSGLKYFHVRKPQSDIQKVRELLNGIAPRFYERIALHQFHEMATEFGIKRLHYTESARKQSSLHQWQLQKDDGYILSTSVHDHAILSSLAYFEYAFYGPVFNSMSKPGYQSKLSVDFKLGKTYSRPKVIALGGVNVSNLISVKTMGFDGAAVLGAVWNEPGKAIAYFNQLKESLAV